MRVVRVVRSAIRTRPWVPKRGMECPPAPIVDFAAEGAHMQFSMIFEAQTADPSRAGEFQVLHECVEQAVLAEQVGFDRVWSVEHHCLKWYAHMSAPETFLAYVAAKTSRIRIGHGVVCLPFRMNHPVKVAERIAMLDILSKGRVDFGIGKGGTIPEAGAFPTPGGEIPPQLEGRARIIPRMWRGETFS